jgi:hypothetical protein
MAEQPIVQLYPTRQTARDAILALEAAGVPAHDISVVARTHAETEAVARDTGADDDLEDASHNRRLHDLVDWLGSIGAAMPGFGPLVGTGNLGLAAARAGDGPGGITGALVGAGIPVDEAQRLEREVLVGQILVLVQGDRHRTAAQSVLAP